MKKTRIVILGGGFAGVYTAQNLCRAMTREEQEMIEVTIVNRENYMVFQPLLPEVISGSVQLAHVVAPIRRMVPKASLISRQVESIDVENRVVKLITGGSRLPLDLPYDHLVLALGSILDGSKIPGLIEHALPFKYLVDALRVRNRIVRCLEEADGERDPALRQALLTYVVAGGGFSGIECVAEVCDFLHEAIRSYPRLSKNEIRIVLLQRGERILPEVTPSLSAYAHQLLEKRGIEIKLGYGLKAVTAESAIIEAKGAKTPEVIPSRMIVATVPAGTHPLLSQLPFAQDRGRIKVTPQTSVLDRQDIWAVGDCGSIMQRDGQTSPPTAQHAIRQAKTCANNILATIRGQPLQVFGFTGLGKMGSLGRRSAVAEVFGMRLRGLPAWLLWRGVYATKFPGLDGQIRLLADWILDVFLPRDITQLRIFDQAMVSREHYEAGEWIFKDGEYGDKVYCIAKGSADVVRDGQIIAKLNQGEIFGESALITGHTRNASIRANSALDLVAVSEEAFKDLMMHLPGVSGAVSDILTSRGLKLPPKE